MRLRLQLRRQGLATTKIWWDTTRCLEDQPNATVGNLLQYVNEAQPLERGNIGLEDYVVEIDGYEVMHYQHVGSLLRDGDEIIIRPMSTAERQDRIQTGRIDITENGRKVIDGIAFGKQLRRSNKPDIRLPSTKRRRIEAPQPEEDDEEHEVGRNALVRFADANLEESDEDFREGSEEVESDSDDGSLDDEEDEEVGELEEGELEELNQEVEAEDEELEDVRGRKKSRTPPGGETTEVAPAPVLRDHNLPTPELQLGSPTVLGKRPHASSDTTPSDEDARRPAKRTDNSASPERSLEQSENVPAGTTAPTTETIVATIMDEDDEEEDDDEFVPDSEEDSESESESDSDDSSSDSEEEGNVETPVSGSKKAEADSDHSEVQDGPVAKEGKKAETSKEQKAPSVELAEEEKAKSDSESSDSSSDDSSDSSEDSSDSDSGSGSSDSDDSDSDDDASQAASNDASDSESDSDSDSSSDSSEEEEEEKDKKKAKALPGPTKFVAPEVTQPDQGERTESPPNQGNSKTRYRNQRKKQRQQLLRLINQGLLPTGSTIATLREAQALVNNGRTLKEACQILMAQKEGSAEGNNSTAAAENASTSTDSQNNIEMQRQPGFSRENSLLDTLVSATPAPVPAAKKTTQKPVNQEEKSFMMANAKFAKNKKKGFLHKMAGRERSYQKYDEDGNPVDVQANGENYDEELAGPNEAWKSKVTLSAVEVGQGYEEEVPTPTFPFQHPYMQMKGKKGKGKGKKKRDFQQQQEYYEDYEPEQYDESMYDDSHMAVDPAPGPDAAIGDDLPPVPANVESLPDLTKHNAVAGAIIIFKQMELQNWQPVLSDYKTAVIDSYDCSIDELACTLAKRDRKVRQIDPETGEPIAGKFELVEDVLNEEDTSVLYTSLAELSSAKVLTFPEGYGKDGKIAVEAAGVEEKETEEPKEDGTGPEEQNEAAEEQHETQTEDANMEPEEDSQEQEDMDAHAQIVQEAMSVNAGNGGVEVVEETVTETTTKVVEVIETEVPLEEQKVIDEPAAEKGVNEEPVGEKGVTEEPVVEEITIEEVSVKETVVEEVVEEAAVELVEPTVADAVIAEEEPTEETVIVEETVAQESVLVESIEEVVSPEAPAAPEKSTSPEPEVTATPVPELNTQMEVDQQVVEEASVTTTEEQTTTVVETQTEAVEKEGVEEAVESTASVGDYTALGLDPDFPTSYQQPETETTSSAEGSKPVEVTTTAQPLDVSMESNSTIRPSAVQTEEASVEIPSEKSSSPSEAGSDEEDSAESPDSLEEADDMDLDESSDDDDDRLRESYADSDIDDDYLGSPGDGELDQDIGMVPEHEEIGEPVRASTPPAPSPAPSPAKEPEAGVVDGEPSSSAVDKVPESPFKVPRTPVKKTPSKVAEPDRVHDTPPPVFNLPKVSTPKKPETAETEPATAPNRIPTPKQTAPESGKSPRTELRETLAQARQAFQINYGGIAPAPKVSMPKYSSLGEKRKEQKRRSLASSPPVSNTLFSSPIKRNDVESPRIEKKRNKPFIIHTDPATKAQQAADDFEDDFPSIPRITPISKSRKDPTPLLSSQSAPSQAEKAFISSSQPEHSSRSQASPSVRRKSSQSTFMDPARLFDGELGKYRDYSSQPPLSLSQPKHNEHPSSSAPLPASKKRIIKQERASLPATTKPRPRQSTGKAPIVDLTQDDSSDDDSYPPFLEAEKARSGVAKQRK